MTAAALANVILSVFSVILVWRLGRTAFGDERIALGAAWIFAFGAGVGLRFCYPHIGKPCSSHFFLLSMERLAEFLRGHRLRVLAAAGLWLAAATFVRPIAYYLPFALALRIVSGVGTHTKPPTPATRTCRRGPRLPPQRQEPVAGTPAFAGRRPPCC